MLTMLPLDIYSKMLVSIQIFANKPTIIKVKIIEYYQNIVKRDKVKDEFENKDLLKNRGETSNV